MANPRTYHRPTTLTDALALAEQYPDALLLGGGAFTLGGTLIPYETVIDLQSVPDLRRVEAGEDGVFFGGACTLQSVVEHADVPAFVKTALTRSVPLNLRNGTSLGESLLLERPLLEWLCALMATGEASIQVYSGGEAVWVTPSAWVDSDAKGLVGGVHIPFARGARVGTAHVARTPADAAIVCAAARVVLDENGLVLQADVYLGGADGDLAVRSYVTGLEGLALLAESIRDVAEQIAAQAHPSTNSLGSAEYRRAMAAVCIRRAMEGCL